MTAQWLACEPRVLLLTGPLEDPTTLAWIRELQRRGVPFDQLTPTQDEPLTPQHLSSRADPAVGRYNAVVLGTDSSTFWGGLDELAGYRRGLQVRLVRGFEYPRDTVGLASVPGASPAGTTARITAAGRQEFPYLRGPVPIDPGAFGYAAMPLTESDFVPLVESTEGHPLIGLHRANGLEELVVTMNYADAMLHWRLLSRGLLDWATRRVHFGHSRYFCACHVDDVFISNWVRGPRVAGGAQVPDTGRPTARMTGADVEATLAWQERNRFTLDLAYNAVGADPSGQDDLTAALLAHRHRFRWLNHTWDHADLGRSMHRPGGAEPDWWDVEALTAQVTRNVDWATAADVRISGTTLVTGAHSGLDNPHLSAALGRAGVAVIASDASVEPEQRQLGPALTLPRHPTNVYTSASTWDEQLAEYADRYGADAAGAASPEHFVAAEASVILDRVLAGDPRPTFAHQSNLTNDRPLLAVLGRVIELYRRYVADDCPLNSPTMTEAAGELARRTRWHEAVEKGTVTARLRGRELVVHTAADVDVPLTVPTGTVHATGRPWRRPPFGEPYAGTASAWHRMQAGDRLRLLVAAE